MSFMEQLKTFAKKSLFFIPDRAYVSLYYRLRLGRKLHLDAPVSLNEKIQWLKFNYRFPLQTVVSDKVLARDYVREKVGEEYLIPSLGTWERPEDIDFDSLPERFVLKCNHDSGGLVICKDKNKLDIPAARKILARSLKSNFYTVGREYQYKNIRPQILGEEFLSDNGNVPNDYKFYCFNGEPDLIMLCMDRFREDTHRASYWFYDTQWNYLPNVRNAADTSDPGVPKPKCLDTMVELARKLSQDFVFARIDLYEVQGKVYFGEITLTPNSGWDPDFTEAADLAYGEKLKIPYWDVIKK